MIDLFPCVLRLKNYLSYYIDPTFMGFDNDKCVRSLTVNLPYHMDHMPISHR